MFLMRSPHRLDPLPCLIYADAKSLHFEDSKAPAESLTFVQHVAVSVSTSPADGHSAGGKTSIRASGYTTSRHDVEIS